MFTTLLEKAVNKNLSLYITAISLLGLVVSQREKLFILQAQHWPQAINAAATTRSPTHTFPPKLMAMLHVNGVSSQYLASLTINPMGM